MPSAGKKQRIFFTDAQDYLHIRMEYDTAQPAVQDTAAQVFIFLCAGESIIKPVYLPEHFCSNKHTFHGSRFHRDRHIYVSVFKSVFSLPAAENAYETCKCIPDQMTKRELPARKVDFLA